MIMIIIIIIIILAKRVYNLVARGTRVVLARCKMRYLSLSEYMLGVR